MCSTGMLMMRPPSTAPVHALEVVSAAVDAVSVSLSRFVSPAVPVVETALPEAEASVGAEPRPPRVATSVVAEARPLLQTPYDC